MASPHLLAASLILFLLANSCAAHFPTTRVASSFSRGRALATAKAANHLVARRVDSEDAVSWNAASTTANTNTLQPRASQGRHATAETRVSEPLVFAAAGNGRQQGGGTQRLQRTRSGQRGGHSPNLGSVNGAERRSGNHHEGTGTISHRETTSTDLRGRTHNNREVVAEGREQHGGRARAADQDRGSRTATIHAATSEDVALSHHHRGSQTAGGRSTHTGTPHWRNGRRAAPAAAATVAHHGGNHDAAAGNRGGNSGREFGGQPASRGTAQLWSTHHPSSGNEGGVHRASEADVAIVHRGNGASGGRNSGSGGGYAAAAAHPMAGGTAATAAAAAHSTVSESMGDYEGSEEEDPCIRDPRSTCGSGGGGSSDGGDYNGGDDGSSDGGDYNGGDNGSSDGGDNNGGDNGSSDGGDYNGGDYNGGDDGSTDGGNDCAHNPAQVSCGGDGSGDGSRSSGGTVDAAAILEEHNSARREAGVPDLAWDDGVAAAAQEWANQLASNYCPLEHGGAEGLGQNLYWSMPAGFTSEEDRGAVRSWVEEKADWTPSPVPEGCAEGKMCGHYTQVVWRDTTHVGCAAAQCPDGSGMWVCDYSPQGNIIGSMPF
ncbi:hypothetical protein CLOM_g16629 [Closterium sp. NIES-68]|nr:hypothetical protein CLOM_g16629 [Closterium sp. NIES-68]